MLIDLERLSPRQLKAEFTRVTGLPAKQSFVWLACPSLANCKIRSKNDWILAIESIELILTPMFDDVSGQEEIEESVEVVEPEPTPTSQPAQPIDAEVSVILNALNDEDRDVETVLQCGFLLASDHKQLYRKLAQRFHPDTSGDEDAELFVLMDQTYKKLTEEPETYGSEENSGFEEFVSDQQWSEQSWEEAAREQLGDDFKW